MANHFDLEEQEQLDQLKHFWKTWGSLISGAVIVVCGGFIAWNGYQYWQNRQAVQAAVLLDAVDSAALSGDMNRVEQAFSDLKSRYGSTEQAAQGGLSAAKAMVGIKNWDGAKAALTWVGAEGKDDGLKALARLRLSSVLVEQKAYDEALKELTGGMPPEFAAAAADRRGDIQALKGDTKAAIAEYQKAYTTMDTRADYRRVIEAKLNALGVDAKAVAATASAGGVK